MADDSFVDINLGVRGSMNNFASLSRTPKSSELVAGQLRQHIVSGGVKDGEFLPLTKDLLERFGVSRPVLQEAFRILENEGLITITRGSRAGARAHLPRAETAARFAALTLQASGTTLGDVYAARLAIEPHAVCILAERHDKRDIVRLRASIAEMKTLTDKGMWRELAADMARFHHLLVELAGNQVLSFMATLIATVLVRHQHHHAYVTDEPQPMPLLSLEERSKGPLSIEKLVRLIEAGDREAAESHWREHIKNANAHWLLSHDEYGKIDMFNPKNLDLPTKNIDI
jgi:DNA-binding FadR family transcriptional regulator